MPFASSKRAYGVCDITGFRYRLKDMKNVGWIVGRPRSMVTQTSSTYA